VEIPTCLAASSMECLQMKPVLLKLYLLSIAERQLTLPF
jgi:hypothetical protein